MVEFALKNKCDCIILVSGDADLIPALKLAEENKKMVYSVFLRSGYSFQLRDEFEYLVMGNEFIKSSCLKDSIVKN